MTNAGLVSIGLSIVLLIGVVTGYRRGFVRQVMELVGLLAAFLLGIFFASVAASFLVARFGFPYSPALVISFIVIFLVALVLFRFIAVAMQKVIGWTLLGWVDRLTGSLLGLLLGMIVTSVLIWLMLAVPLPAGLRSGIERSEVSMFLQPVAPRIFNLVFDHGPRKMKFERVFERDDSA
jgi:membrane protein required for colicin V production